MPTRLRVMQITHDMDLGGLQQVIYNICRSIDRALFDVSVLCLRSRGRFTEDVEALGIPVLQIEHDSDRPDYFAYRKVARILAEQRIDVVHTHNTQPFIDGTIGAWLAGVPTIVHTDHARSFPDKMRYMIAEWLMSQFAYRVVGCSDHTSRNLVKYEKISTRKIVTIPNGIDPARFDVEVDREVMRASLGVKKDGPMIGLAVRLSDQKGITYLIKAMPAVLERHPETTLVVAGDGDLEADLKAEAAALGLGNDVVFCGPRHDIPELLRSLDLYVLPSNWEGLPMVILEAMASECPVVATDVGANSTAVLDGQTGVLVPSKDPQALSRAIIRCLDDPAERARFAAAALVHFNAHFHATTMTRRYEQIYQRRSLESISVG